MHCGICDKAMNSDWRYCPHCGAKETTPDNTQQPARSGSPYGRSVRAQVFEVVVRQAVAGAPWRQICAGPMKVNNITEEMVEEELERRKNGSITPSLDSPPEPPLPSGNALTNSPTTQPSKVIENIASLLEDLAQDNHSTFNQKQAAVKHLAQGLRFIIIPVREMEEKSSKNA